MGISSFASCQCQYLLASIFCGVHTWEKGMDRVCPQRRWRKGEEEEPGGASWCVRYLPCTRTSGTTLTFMQGGLAAVCQAREGTLHPCISARAAAVPLWRCIPAQIFNGTAGHQLHGTGGSIWDTAEENELGRSIPACLLLLPIRGGHHEPETVLL